MAENSRVTQTGAEFLSVPDDAASRVTQTGAEFLSVPIPSPSRVTQAGAMVLFVPRLSIIQPMIIGF